MSADLRIQRKNQGQGVVETPKPVDKSSVNKKVGDLVQSHTLAIYNLVTKEHKYSRSGNRSDQGTIHQIFHDVFTSNGQLPKLIQEVIRSYIPEETGHILNPLAPFVDLSDPIVLKTFFSKKFQTDQHIYSALQIVQRTYETHPRFLRNDFGLAFPMNPEILAYAMQLAKNETVLEIAGAYGEDAILMGFTDAEKVYLNEIEPGAIRDFEGLKKTLPGGVSKKLKSIQASCLDLLKKDPELEGKIGLILCRNLIHFLDDGSQADFFELIKKLLKPGGHVIITTNSRFTFPAHRTLFETHADSTMFNVNQCFISDYAISQMPCSVIYDEVTLCTTGILAKKNCFFLYQKNPETRFKWKVDNEQFNTLDPALQSKIQEAFNKNKKRVAAIMAGDVRVMVTSIRIYGKENLVRLVSSYGFETERSFVVGGNGHVIEKDFYDKGQHVGVIFKKPL